MNTDIDAERYRKCGECGDQRGVSAIYICGARDCYVLCCSVCWFAHNAMHTLAQDELVESYIASVKSEVTKDKIKQDVKL